MDDKWICTQGVSDERGCLVTLGRPAKIGGSVEPGDGGEQPCALLGGFLAVRLEALLRPARMRQVPLDYKFIIMKIIIIITIIIIIIVIVTYSYKV